MKIPITMATQHPDSASRFLSAKDEIKEAILSFKPFEKGGFDCDEQMIDYEGKLTPYHQPRWIVEAIAKELELTPGTDYLLTPRIPAEKLEEVDRQIMVLWSVISANRYSRLYGGDCVKYAIHPMVETTKELIVLHRRILKLGKFAEEEAGLHNLDVRLIPLFEDALKMVEIDKIMDGYCQGLIGLGEEYDYFRIFLGKSDTAMIYGHLSSVLALKLGLSKIAKWSENIGINVYPIIGVGKLPFRGHLSPENVGRFVKEYVGYHTVTIQSGLRYDIGIEGTKRVIECLRENVARPIKKFDEETENFLLECMRICTNCYLRFIFPISHIFSLSDFIPERRERMERMIYPRSFSPCLSFIADEKLLSILPEESMYLPRAIKFTATLYLIGIPPSLIGTGRTLDEIAEEIGESALEQIITEIYPSLLSDIRYDLQFYDEALARRYVNKDVLKLVKEDVKKIGDIFGIKREETELGKLHSEILWSIKDRLDANKEIADLALESGKIRDSLG
jgi:phosphoenolpyruvate carboxylase